MPARIRKLSAAAQFAKSIDGPPTPWISPSWTEITQDPKHPADRSRDYIRTIQLTFRLWVRRRGHSVHIETREDSPNCPGQIKRVHLSRQGVHYTLTSAHHLLRLAKWDRNQPPTNPRAVWDRTKPGYADIKEHIEVVAKGMMRILEPKLGRPRADRPEPLTGEINVRGAYRAARNVRRNEIMRAMDKIDGILVPIMERFTGNRMKMAGFEKGEKEETLHHLHTLQRTAQVLRNYMATDLYVAGQADVHSTPTAAPTRKSPDLSQPLQLDLTEFENMIGFDQPLQ